MNYLQLKFDAIEPLLSAKNNTINYFIRRDLLEEEVEPIKTLWELREVQKIANKQQEDGSWKYPGQIREHLRSQEDYNQIETFRILGELIEKYGLNKEHSSIQMAANYFFSCQTKEGDIRGILGNQYLPYYTGEIMALLIKAGYFNDPHIEKGFKWLNSVKQDDGGWAFPIRTRNINLKQAFSLQEPVQTDRSKPFSHLVTGMVLRAYAAHPQNRKSANARKAGKLLSSRFFKADKYPDRRDKKYWERVSYPFWFTDIISALDSLSWLGFTRDDDHVQKGLDFLYHRQNNEGLFDLKIVRGSDEDLKYWISLAVCRLFKRYGYQAKNME